MLLLGSSAVLLSTHPYPSHAAATSVAATRFLNCALLTQSPLLPHPQAVAEDGSGGELATSSKLNLNRAQRHRAQQIYDFCQLEGGRFWDYR